LILETAADVANQLIQTESWDHKSFNDNLLKQIDPPTHIPDTAPFKTARRTSVEIPINEGKLISTLMTVLGWPWTHKTTPNSVLILAIRSLSRPVDENDIIPRKDIISTKKFKAESRMEEQKTVLGWVLNTRTLSIHLPHETFDNWLNDIKSILNSKSVNSKSLEYLSGRLNHVANIYPPMRHFLGPLYQAQF
jgi:hypothetical protein